MLQTGWDWPTLAATPERIVTEKLIYESVKDKYESERIANARAG